MSSLAVKDQKMCLHDQAHAKVNTKARLLLNILNWYFISAVIV